MSENSNSENLPPLYFDGVMLTYTDSLNIWAWYATSRSIWIPRLTQNFAHSRQTRSESKCLFRNTTLLTDYTRTYGFSRHTLFRLVCMRVRFGPLLAYNKAKRWTVPFRNGCCLAVLKRMLGVSVEKDVGSQRHHAFMVCHARVWIRTPTVQLVSRGNAAVQSSN